MRQPQRNEDMLRNRQVKSSIAGVNKYNKTIPSSHIKVTPSNLWKGGKKK